MNTVGWTPCRHFDNCVGWCPKCLRSAAVLDRPVTVHYSSNDPEFLALLRLCAEADTSLRDRLWKALRP